MSFGFSVSDFLELIKLVNDARKNWKDAPEEYAAIKNETTNLCNILRDLEDVLGEDDLTDQQKKDLKDVQISCTVVLNKLQEVEKKYIAITMGNTTTGVRARTRRTWMRLRAEPEDIRNLRSLLISNITAITAIYTSINAWINREIRDDITQLLADNEDNKRAAISEWFAKATFAEQFNALLFRHQPGTGQGLLNSSQYSTWLNGQNSILLCPGIPGSGKTMMTTVVIHDLHNRFQADENVMVIYHYCDYALHDNQHFLDFMSSSVRQLIQTRKTIPDAAKKVYNFHKDKQTKPTKDELRRLISDLLGLYSKVFLVIDALDECQNEDLTRDDFLTFWFDQQKQKQGKIHLFATSRPIPRILDRFHTAERLEIQASREDVSLYLNSQMDRLSCKVDNDLQISIKETIAKAADGVFLLVRLHFDSLSDNTKPRDIRRALVSLPTGEEALSAAYRSARDRIDSQPPKHVTLAHRVLSFITYSHRVMNVEELRHALAIEEGMHVLDTQEDCDDESLLTSVCAGLVIVDDQTRDVRLVHYTTQEYLEKVRSSWLHNGLTDLTMSCLSYLMMDAFRCGKVKPDDFQSFPFLKHAAQLWGQYVSVITNQGITNETEKRIATLTYSLMNGRTCDFIVQVLEGGHVKILTGFTPLHFCAYFGLTTIVTSLTGSYKVTAADSFDRNPLHWAAARGHAEVVRILLDKQQAAGINAQDDFNETPLSVAARQNHVEIVKLLVDKGCDLNRSSKYSSTPLSRAIKDGHVEVAKELIDAGCNISKLNKDGLTPLMQVVELGQVEIMKLLINKGCEVDQPDKDGRTPLAQAVVKGNVEAVKLLIDGGCDIDRLNKHGRTPLSRAVVDGHIEVAKLLINRGCDVDRPDRANRTPLTLAVGYGQVEWIKLLLDAGCDVERKNMEGNTPLLLAAIDGHIEVVRTLLTQGKVNVNGRDNKNRTALSRAAQSGEIEIMKLLLSANADKELADSDLQTPLTWALAGNKIDAVKLLSDNNMIVSKQN